MLTASSKLAVGPAIPAKLDVEVALIPRADTRAQNEFSSCKNKPVVAQALELGNGFEPISRYRIGTSHRS